MRQFRTTKQATLKSQWNTLKNNNRILRCILTSVHKICAGASAGAGKVRVQVRRGWKCKCGCGAGENVKKSYFNTQRHS